MPFAKSAIISRSLLPHLPTATFRGLNEFGQYVLKVDEAGRLHSALKAMAYWFPTLCQVLCIHSFIPNAEPGRYSFPQPADKISQALLQISQKAEFCVVSKSMGCSLDPQPSPEKPVL